MRSSDPYREVGLFKNTKTGEYIIVQGRNAFVAVDASASTGDTSGPRPGGELQRWKADLLATDVGTWEVVAHTHPSQGRTGVVHPANEYPSSAAGDFGVLVQESMAGGGKPRASEITYMTRDGPKTTLFGFDPTRSEPYWVLRPNQDPLRFRSLQDYQAHMEAMFPGQLAFKPVPDWMPVGGGAPVPGWAPPAGVPRVSADGTGEEAGGVPRSTTGPDCPTFVPRARQRSRRSTSRSRAPPAADVAGRETNSIRNVEDSDLDREPDAPPTSTPQETEDVFRGDRRRATEEVPASRARRRASSSSTA